MKRLLKVLSFLPVLLVLGSCEFVLGPDTPAGEGNLSVSVGANGRAISSGADLPAEVLSGMVYKLKLSGPNDEVIEAEVAGEGTLNVTVTPGQWRIDARAYQEDVLAGTGHVSFTVSSGFNSVRVPMMIKGGYFNITPSPMSGGAVKSSFDAAFPDTTITLTPLPDEGYVFKTGTLKYRYGGSDYTPAGSGPDYTFTMPESDVTVSAEFTDSLIRYVRAGGSGNGRSWANASGDLQAMMDELAELYDSGLYPGPFVVKAAAGTYRPQYKPTNAISANGTPERTTIPSTTDRDSAFILRKGVQVWGGYPASGGDDASRNITAHETILSGDIGTSGDSSDNAHHVVVGLGVDHKTVLSGLTITGGNANGSSYITAFGSCTVLRDSGGGIYCGVNTSDEHSPVLIGVRISGNYSSDWGGGMHNYQNRAVLINVLVSGNVSDSRGGGISNVTYTNLFVINSTLSGNYSSSTGSLANDNSTPQIMNSVIWGNTGGIYDGFSTSTVSNSIVEGGFTGTGNLDVDPSFAGPVSPSAAPFAGGDYRLTTGSPAIDVGDDANYPDTWTKWQSIIGAGGISTEAEYDTYIAPHLGKDLDGNTRKNGAIDMGACEKQ